MNHGADAPGANIAVPADPTAAGTYLLSLDATLASGLFEELPDVRQLEIIEATPDPYDREELYYLVPDCTGLVQQSSLERLLEVLNTGMWDFEPSLRNGLPHSAHSASDPKAYTYSYTWS